MDNGTKYTSVLYEMKAGDERFVVETVVSSDDDGLYYVYINDYDDAVADGYIIVQTTGVANWIFRLILLAELVFLIIVIVDCSKHKMKLKPLWLVIIILGSVSFILMSSSDGLFARFNLLDLLGTYLNTYSDNSFEMGLSLPVGAVIYLIMRKKLFREWKKEQDLKEEMAARNSAPTEDIKETESLDEIEVEVGLESDEKTDMSESNVGEETLIPEEKEEEKLTEEVSSENSKEEESL
jgi:hypothetical protein